MIDWHCVQIHHWLNFVGIFGNFLVREFHLIQRHRHYHICQQTILKLISFQGRQFSFQNVRSGNYLPECYYLKMPYIIYQKIVQVELIVMKFQWFSFVVCSINTIVCLRKTLLFSEVESSTNYLPTLPNEGNKQKRLQCLQNWMFLKNPQA